MEKTNTILRIKITIINLTKNYYNDTNFINISYRNYKGSVDETEKIAR